MAVWPSDLKQRVIELRASGATIGEISETVRAEFGQGPNESTVWKWITDPEAISALRVAESRIRARVAQHTAEVIGKAYTKLEAALDRGDLRAADCGARVVMNLTRGIVGERHEIVAPRSTADPDELAQLLARHGVKLTQEAEDG